MKSKYLPPPITLALIAINVAVFIFTVVVGGDMMHPPTTTLQKLGANIYGVTDHGEWWRLLTSMFLHAGLIHILLNMYGLYSLSLFFEPAMGRVKYLVIYLVAGLVGSLASLYITKPGTGVGASGAVFGIMGGVAVYLLVNRSRYDQTAWKKQMMELGVVFAVNIIYGLMRPEIDDAAHLGGLVAGAGMTWALLRRR